MKRLDHIILVLLLFTENKDGDNVDESEAEDSDSDRLVIDEGNEVSGSDSNRTDNGSEAANEVPLCQGCNQKSALFVCADCRNQWYCSRDCQVAAWDEHSYVCLAGDEVPLCQGCHQKSAQFICAGCRDQWYCSRDCQVAAWEEHSEVCSQNTFSY